MDNIVIFAVRFCPHFLRPRLFDLLIVKVFELILKQISGRYLRFKDCVWSVDRRLEQNIVRVP